MNEKMIDIQVVPVEKDGELTYVTKLDLNGEADLVAEAFGNILTTIGENDMSLLVKILAEHRKSFDRILKKGELEE